MPGACDHVDGSLTICFFFSCMHACMRGVCVCVYVCVCEHASTYSGQ